MSDQAIPGRSDNGRSTLMRMYVFLGGFALLIFAWCLSGDCYFSASVYQVATWSMVVFAVLWMVVIARSLHRKGYVVPSQAGPHKLAPVAVPFYIAFMGCLVAWMCWLGFYALLNLLVFVTSRTPAITVTRLEISHAGGRCGTHYDFDDPFLQRMVGNCGVPYWGARSGDRISVMQEIGPFGMHLDRVTREL